MFAKITRKDLGVVLSRMNRRATAARLECLVSNVALPFLKTEDTRFWKHSPRRFASSTRIGESIV